MVEAKVTKRSRKSLITVGLVGILLLFATLLGVSELASLGVLGSGWETKWYGPILKALSGWGSELGLGR